MIIGPLANGGVSLDAAPLVRQVAASAYSAGAPLVETLWGDEGLQIARFRQGAAELFHEFFGLVPACATDQWKRATRCCRSRRTIPTCFRGEPPALVSALQQTAARSVRPFRELISRNQVNWTVVAAASPGGPPASIPTLRPAIDNTSGTRSSRSAASIAPIRSRRGGSTSTRSRRGATTLNASDTMP